MLQGDPDWRTLSAAITFEDHAAVVSHNTRTTAIAADTAIKVAHGPVPFLGAVMTAPVVLLLSHPETGARSTLDDYAFQRDGWPFAALHPDAPGGIGDLWRARFAALIDIFGAQHVANAIATTFLTPWCSVAFAERLRLPSRPRMLGLAAATAARDAVILPLRHATLWTEHEAIAALPATRRFQPRLWRAAEINVGNLGDVAWTALCKRIEVHAWI